MNLVSIGAYRPVHKLHPPSLLTQYISQSASGCLQVFSGGNVWLLHLAAGKLVYASDLTDAFGRLDRQLRQLQLPSLRSAIRVQVRIMFETPTVDEPAQDSDYRAICWLVEQEHLTPEQAAYLIERLAQEVLELLLPIQSGSFELVEQDLLSDYPKFCQLDLQALLDRATQQMQQRQANSPPIPMTSERLNFANPAHSPTLPLPRALQQSTATPIGSNPPDSSASTTLPQGSATNPTINPAANSAIDSGTQATTADSPVQPFLTEPPQTTDRLSSRLATGLGRDSTEVRASAPTARAISPTGRPLSSSPPAVQPAASSPQSQPESLSESLSESLGTAQRLPSAREKTYTIACIDDSPTVLQAINSFLHDRSLTVVLINDPVKALMQIIRSKPDLILLDVTMPNLDGYELCSLLRKHPTFRETPIIMVTGKTGFIDRAKAKLVGASGYLTKPFTQPDLLKLVFRHLS